MSLTKCLRIFVSLGCFCLLSSLAFSEDPPAAPTPTGTSAPAATTPDAQPSAAAAEEPGVSLVRAVLCHAVQDRQPQEEVTAGKVGDVLVGWTQVKMSGEGETTIKHRWVHEGNTEADVELPVKGSPWRTWSRKTITEPGNWEWQVVDNKGAVLNSMKFTASTEEAAPAAPAAAPSSQAPSAPAAPAAPATPSNPQ